MTRSRLLISMVFAAAALLLSAPSGGLAKTAAKTTLLKTTKTEGVDINAASKADLMWPPGIDDATAQKIIDDRPYARNGQLLAKKIVSRATYDNTKDELVAKKSKK